MYLPLLSPYVVDHPPFLALSKVVRDYYSSAAVGKLVSLFLFGLVCAGRATLQRQERRRGSVSVYRVRKTDCKYSPVHYLLSPVTVAVAVLYKQRPQFGGDVKGSRGLQGSRAEPTYESMYKTGQCSSASAGQ